jgi:hypothetical protein
MSVIVTVSVQGDPRKLEEHAAANEDELRGIRDAARGHGLIAHRFYGSDDGQIMVIDEWPDEQSFHTFFEETSNRIGPLMQAAGASSAPQVRVWRKLDTRDEVGWEG